METIIILSILLFISLIINIILAYNLYENKMLYATLKKDYEKWRKEKKEPGRKD